MKRSFTPLWLSAILLLSAQMMFGQLSGTKNIPGDYADLAAAITDLNTQGVGAGGVTLNLVAGNPQTAPAGGYSITTLTGTAGNPITIQGNANTITASPALTVGNLNDAIFKIIGADYVTITGFTMLENPANTITAAATNNMTEWGVALLYTTTTNGAQNNTIQSNTIDLNRTYQNTFGIYSNSAHSATTVTVSATATTTAGGNSGLKIYSNNITDVNEGIVVVGPTAAADFNNGLEIGGTAPNANTITNYGTTGTFSSYIAVSGTVFGILVRNTINYNVSYNNITSSSGASGVVSGTLRAIYVPSFSIQPTGTFTNNVNNNTIAVTSHVLAGALQGISVEITTSTITSTTNINNNNITTLNHTIAAATGVINGILHSGSTTAGPLNHSISNNTFTNITSSSTGSFTFIGNSWARPTSGVGNVNNNSIVTAFNKTGAGGTVTFYSSNSTSGATINEINTGNNFSNVTVTGATIIAGWATTDGGSPTKTVTGNTFSNWVGGTSAITGLSVAFSSASNVSNNLVSNISSAGTITGITSGTGTETFTQNTVHTLTSSGAVAVTGIANTGGTTKTYARNKIYNLENTNAAGTVNGITVSSGTTISVDNNLIGDLRAPSATTATTVDAIRGINITSTTATSNVNISYNSVYINATSAGANFFTSGIFHTTSATATTAALNMRNNVIVNTSTPAGTGITSAYRRSSATLANYGATSNNNGLYAGTPSATNVLFYDGTNSDQTIAAYKSRVTQRDAASFTENPTFVSTVGSSPNFLHINTSVPTQIESGGAAIAGITDDYDGDARNATTPDAGADEFTGVALDLTGPSIYYSLLGGTLSTSNRSFTPVTITDPNGVNTSSGTKPRVYYKRTTDANAFNDNTSGTDGWKYAEASNVSSPFSFTIDYSLLNGGTGVAPGQSIQYFVVAQDLVGTPNVGITSGTFAAAPSSVALTSAAFPIGGTIINQYKIIDVPLGGDYTVGTTLFQAVTGLDVQFEARQRKVMKEVPIEIDGLAISDKSTEQHETVTSLIGSPKTTTVKEVTETYFVPVIGGKEYKQKLYHELAQAERQQFELGDAMVGIYATIGAAVADLNERGVTGATRFLLTDATYPTETFPIAVNFTSGSVPTAINTVTFRPASGITTALTGSSTTSILQLNGADYITLDGAMDGSTATRDWTIINSSTSTSSGVLLVSSGADGAQNNTIKNLNIRGNDPTQTIVGISLGGGTVGTAGTDNDNNRVQNCSVQRSVYGIYSAGASLANQNTGTVITQNDLSGTTTNRIRRVGILLFNDNSGVVSYNTVGGIDNTGESADAIGIGIGTQAVSGTTATAGGITNTTVNNNKVNGVSQDATFSAAGIAVAGDVGGANAIQNNLVSGVIADANAGDIVAGIFVVGSAGSDTRLYFNSIQLTGDRSALLTPGTAQYPSYGIAITGTDPTVQLKDNIFYDTQTAEIVANPNAKSYAIGMVSTTFVNLNSNYNDFWSAGPQDGGFRTGSLATAAGTSYPDIAAWRTATSQDANSIEYAITFLSATDAHLDNVHNGDVNLKGTPAGGVTIDFDNQTRDAGSPYVGADELSIPLPIQLAYLNAVLNNNGLVNVRWGTVSEINNYGFEVQKSQSINENFATIPNSFVAGHGTTNEPQHYAFVDNTTQSGSWYYRLKQIDLDGTAHYTEPVHVDVLTGVPEPAPREFALKQNYPNPFNPETIVKFSVENTARATLEVYNVLGQKVATLFDEIAEAGQYYKVRLNGTSLASGMYIYRLQSGTRTDVKKMLLMK